MPASQPPSLSSSDITAIASACVAVCALFMTLWQAKIARRHNRLSVRPGSPRAGADLPRTWRRMVAKQRSHPRQQLLTKGTTCLKDDAARNAQLDFGPGA